MSDESSDTDRALGNERAAAKRKAQEDAAAIDALGRQMAALNGAATTSASGGCRPVSEPARHPEPSNEPQLASARPPAPLTQNEKAVDAAIRAGRDCLRMISARTGILESSLSRHAIPALKKKRVLKSRP